MAPHRSVAARAAVRDQRARPADDLLVVADAARARGLEPLYYVERQGLAIVIGVIAMAVVMAIDYRRIRDLWLLVYLAVLPLLVGVLVLGRATRARRRGSRSDRSSSSRRRSRRSWWSSRSPATAISIAAISTPGGSRSRIALAGFVMALVFLQHDLGTMLVILVCSFSVLVVAGLRPVHIGVLVLIGVDARRRGRRHRARSRRTASTASSASSTSRTRNQPASKQTQAQYNLTESKIAIVRRRPLGRRAVQGPPDQPRLRARAAHRLHLHGGG